MVKAMEKIWMDGKLVPWQEANVHILTHTLHYGLGCFEGLRIYKCVDGRSAIFRLTSHIRRLFYSVHVAELKIPFSQLEIEQAVIETVKANKLEEGYIRPLVFVGDGDMGPLPKNNPVRLAIITWEWGHYLGSAAINNGISVKISKWRRSARAMPFQAKICGNYVNAALAKREVEKDGFQEAIILDEYGHVAEGSAENIFIAKNGKLMTPSAGLPILRGITRDTVICLALEKSGMRVEETLISEDLLFDADEAFFTGTAAEITPIKEIGEQGGGEIATLLVGRECPGPITRKLQELYFKLVRGELPDYQKRWAWLTYVD